MELTLIRWLPSNIYSLAFFSNLVLIATFYGFGLGILSGKLSFNLIKIWPVYFLFFVISVLAMKEFNILIPQKSIEWMWCKFQGDQLTHPLFYLSLEPALILLFFLIAFIFMPLGQYFSKLMIKVEALSFYHFDLVGSLFGIIFFTILSSLKTSPVLWFTIAIIFSLPIIKTSNKKFNYIYLILLFIIPFLIQTVKQNEKWSPYYSIIKKNNSASLDFKVYVNRFYHQEAIDFNKKSIWGYDIPYLFWKSGDVLIVGAGTGNDVSIALKNGASSIDAIEIDPVIRLIGNEHPLRPYSDSHVKTVIQDARTFLQTTNKKYDLIVFGTLDSHALMSNVSSVRLDNYVYTIESIYSAKRCLKKDGVLAMLYSIPTEWMYDRFKNMIAKVFTPENTLCFRHSSNFLNFVVIAKNNGKFDEKWNSHRVNSLEDDVIIPTDDWPFLYLQTNSIPDYLLIVIGSIIIIGSIPVLLLLPKGKKLPHKNFLLLGIAFLLLETMTVTRMSILFGSTWIVNSVVFFMIIFMILLANKFVQNMNRFQFNGIYWALIISLALNYYFGPEKFLYSSFFIKVAGAGTLAAVPVFFAGIIFSNLFKLEKDIQYAFGSNLLGTLIGGFLEYISMIVGFKSLILVIIVIYLLSKLCAINENQT